MSKLLSRGSYNIIEVLSDLRTKALRRGIWFTTLTHEERLLTALIKKQIKIVKNATLATVIARMVVKLLYAIKNSFSNMIDKLGRPMAESWARGAYAIGWKEACAWTSDPNIVRWFGLLIYYSNTRKVVDIAK